MGIAISTFAQHFFLLSARAYLSPTPFMLCNNVLIGSTPTVMQIVSPASIEDLEVCGWVGMSDSTLWSLASHCPALMRFSALSKAAVFSISALNVLAQGCPNLRSFCGFATVAVPPRCEGVAEFRNGNHGPREKQSKNKFAKSERAETYLSRPESMVIPGKY